MFEHFKKQSKNDWIEQAKKETQKYEAISFPYYFSLDELELSAINTNEENTSSDIILFPHRGAQPLISIWLPDNNDKSNNFLYQEVGNLGVEDIVIEFSSLNELALTAIDSRIGSIAAVTAITEFELILGNVLNHQKDTAFNFSFYSSTDKDPGFQSPTTKAENESLVKLICEHDSLESASLIGIRGDGFTNLGASVVLELAGILSQLAFYWDKTTDQGVSSDKLIGHTEIMLGLGGEFYLDLIKFRAMRHLLHYFLDAYQVKDPNPFRIKLRAVSGVHNKTLYDPDGNLLRNTTEALAASLGGADIISLKTHDLYYKSVSEFSRRIAVNIQHLMREESHLSKVKNPTEGSYFLKNATEQLINKSWQLFLEIEKHGGITQFFSSSKGIDLLNNSQAEKRKRVNKQEKTVVGVTKYVNPDQIIDNATVQTDLLENSQTAAWEKLRLKLDQLSKESDKRTVVILRQGNNNHQVSGRIIFVTNLLMALGLQYLIKRSSSDSLSTSASGIVIICGDNDWYYEELEELLKSKTLADTSVFAVGNMPLFKELQNQELLTGDLHANSDLSTFINTNHQKILHET